MNRRHGSIFWPVIGSVLLVDLILCSALYAFGWALGWWEWIALHGGQ